MLIGKDTAIRTPEFNKKMERKRLLRNILISMIMIIVIAVPIYLLRTQKFLISTINLAGNSVTKSEDIESIVSKDLDGNFLWIFPKSNIALYSKKQIEQDLLRAIPRLSSVDISLSSVHSIKVLVSERLPVALYCKDITNPNSPTGCYFLDDQGFIFSEAPSFSDGVYTVFSSDPVFDEPLGKTYLAPDVFAPINPFIKTLEESGLYPKAFVTTVDEYHLILSNGGLIEWKSSTDFEQIRSSIASLIIDPSFLKESNALDNLLYIDLRYGNKVFYKFRDGR